MENIWNSLGEYDKSLFYQNKILENKIKAYGDLHQEVAISYGLIGDTFFYKGNHEKAIEFYQKSLEIYLKMSDSVGEIGSAICYGKIGTVLDTKNEYQKAKIYYEKALEIFQSHFGSDNDYTVKIRNLLESLPDKELN